jgi:ArsR family transcriptional regulator
MTLPIDEMERLFLALSDKTRIRLIGLMSKGEVSVNYLCDALDVSQPKVSRHLAYLRSTGVVSTRRDGKWIYYSLSWPEDPVGVKCFEDILQWISSQQRRKRSVSPINAAELKKPYEFDSATDSDIYEQTNISDRDQADLDVYLL